MKKSEHYEEYCSVVTKENTLSYQWWNAVMHRCWLTYEDMKSYVMLKNRPMGLAWEEYIKACPWEPFNRQWFTWYYKKNPDLDYLIKMTIENPNSFRYDMSEYRKMNKEKIDGIYKKLRDRREELWHVINY